MGKGERGETGRRESGIRGECKSVSGKGKRIKKINNYRNARET